jgi:hypothetical protein
VTEPNHRKEGDMGDTDNLYFMRNGDANVVKIGIAGDVDARRGQFKTGNPEDIIVIDVVEADNAQPIETIVHRLNYSKRLRGEFYALDPSEAETVGRQARQVRDEYLPLEQGAKRLARAECDAPPRSATGKDRALHRQVLEKREAKYLADYECKLAEYAYMAAVGTSEGIEDLVSWKTLVVPDFDEAAFKKDHSELYGAYVRPRRQRRFRLLWL